MAKKIGRGKASGDANLDVLGLEMGKRPPQAVDIEEAVLGALMLEPTAITDVLDIISPDCFYKETNRKIFTAISALAAKHAPVDIFTVSDELKNSGDLESVGGASYLSQLSMKIGAAAHIDYHAKILLQKYIQRELISISYGVQKDAFDDAVSVDDLLDTTQQKIFTLADRNMRKEAQVVQYVINQAIDDLQKNQLRTDGLSGVPSGYTSVDRVTLGWQPSDLIIIAARPSMGKTAFVLTMARNMAVDHKVPVAFFSLEMSSVQLVKRLMISETGLDGDKIKGGSKLKDYEWEQLHSRLKQLVKAPMYIDDTPSLSINELRSKARKLVLIHGVKLIIIDYLQLMTGPPELRGMREQEVSAISRSLKAIAKELEVPVIALSQLSRAVETRGGTKRPQLSDLRESGAIEQDADIVVFIHRQDYYNLGDDNPALKGVSDIIIAKHRNGAVCDVQLRFRSSEVKFTDMTDTSLAKDPLSGGFETYPSRMNQQEFMSNSDFEKEF
ncbi:MAG: replicative DNA helicase [Bacteroidetes bacterium GWE2_39_28]|jgi:replicative DNA helicase|nr:MAG: replicative DNA helicase [Bacteroidetes bacterium GWE2_39_28]OFY12463.1 MAG: replicative DNA helicase [Bacteroidetes bacterium GWF2_39_10]OFZ08788.1 MAG: replicative DNA helicase [Bacteroidetes bacterium RIFOXYB2_FULL_39_7]OFZ10676.1 MAG: replicative DNA helicase [Bacteroidetes bacterium RIFOXYC2_FULL_39_11]HCT93409.1 replicative DNA helicase [Rikenellaceae bacterium]